MNGLNDKSCDEIPEKIILTLTQPSSTGIGGKRIKSKKSKKKSKKTKRGSLKNKLLLK